MIQIIIMYIRKHGKEAFCRESVYSTCGNLLRIYQIFNSSPEQLDRKAPVKVSGLKIIADGGISGRTAWCNRPYLGGDGREQGIPTCTEDHIRSAIRFCKKYNAQLAVHAMGQSAIDRAVNVISEVEDWLDSDLPHARDRACFYAD